MEEQQTKEQSYKTMQILSNTIDKNKKISNFHYYIR